MPSNFTYTEPQIVTTFDINKRSYIEFYFDGKRIRIGNADTLGQRISPNRAKTIEERNRLLAKLHYELKKTLELGNYPVSSKPTSTVLKKSESALKTQTALELLFQAVRDKLRSTLSKKYKRNLKVIYRQFKRFMSHEELAMPLSSISTLRIEAFLNQFSSTGTYYMNKRRDLGVLFNSAGRAFEQPLVAVKRTAKKKVKATLHKPYEKEQLKPILNYLQGRDTNLYVCCLLTYSSWLRPHEEIRLLTIGNFTKDFTEIHLSGDENKGGKVRVVYIPEYVRKVIVPLVSGLDRASNIFSRSKKSFNESYFTTQWGCNSHNLI